ncbi:MAG: RNase adapter RapZ, partial [Ignavibacteriaceae bacterium]
QAKANLSHQLKEELLEYYLEEISQRSNLPAGKAGVKRQTIKKYYYGYVLIRLLQTLGAYGFRGYYENKVHFLLSIPYALKNLQWLVEENHIPKKLPELSKVINSILENDDFKKVSITDSGQKLKVTINSFTYKEGPPKDFTGNGGGFVFDCRSIDNPGRYPEFKDLTGLDAEVIQYLAEKDSVKDFLNSVYSITENSVKNYIKRDFNNLMINFGCTGGQHRSVYCAESLAKHLKDNFDVQVEVNHTQLDKAGIK